MRAIPLFAVALFVVMAPSVRAVEPDPKFNAIRAQRADPRTRQYVEAETLPLLRQNLRELRALPRTRETELAIQTLRGAFGVLGKMEDALPLARNDEDRQVIFLQRVKYLLGIGRGVEAETLLPKMDASRKVQAALEIGELWLQRGNKERAADLARRAATTGQRLQDLEVARCAALLARCGYQEESLRLFGLAADQEYSKSLLAKSGNPELILAQLVKAGFPDQAIAHFSPNDSIRFSILVDELCRGGYMAQAEVFVRSRENTDRKSQGLIVLAGYYWTAKDTAKVDEILQEYRQVIDGWEAAKQPNAKRRLATVHALLGHLDAAEALLRETHTVPDLEMTELLAGGATQFAPEKLPQYHQAFMELIRKVPARKDSDPGLDRIAELTERYLEFGHKSEAVELLELAEQRWNGLPPGPKLRALPRLAVAWRRLGKLDWGQEQFLALRRTRVEFSDFSMMLVVDAIGDSAVPEFAVDLGRRKVPETLVQLAGLQSWRRFAPPPAWIKNLRDPVNRAYALNGWAEGIRPTFVTP